MKTHAHATFPEVEVVWRGLGHLELVVAAAVPGAAAIVCGAFMAGSLMYANKPMLAAALPALLLALSLAHFFSSLRLLRNSPRAKGSVKKVEDAVGRVGEAASPAFADPKHLFGRIDGSGGVLVNANTFEAAAIRDGRVHMFAVPDLKVVETPFGNRGPVMHLRAPGTVADGIPVPGPLGKARTFAARFESLKTEFRDAKFSADLPRR